VWTEFEGKATRSIDRWRGDQDQSVADPYLGISSESRFTVSKAAQLRPEITLDRLSRRRGLLEQLEQEQSKLDRSLKAGSLERFQQMAYSLITSRELREALDVSRETAEMRERYGMTLFGQSTLVGRRLLEAGSKLVTVIWDEIGPANTAWDTHFNHYERLKNELLPSLDRALSALILDLETRGMLDDTLILCLTEHGRTPKFNNNGGRDHWARTYSIAMAGGGVAKGKLVGESDATAADVKSNPISPKDILATIYYLLGIDPLTTVPDRLSRPIPIAGTGKLRPEIF
jgi:hypothetical protein